MQANDGLERITGVDISPEDFAKQYQETETPVVITKVTRHWAANEKDLWSTRHMIGTCFLPF